MHSKLLDEADSGRRTYAVVFDTDDRVMTGLRSFAAEHGMDAASVTAIGAFRSATLAYFDIEAKEYQNIPVPEQVEVLSLIGDITQSENGPQVHAHCVVGRPDGTTRGGHLKEATVRPTCEVIVTESPQHLRRRFDATAGLPLIDIPASEGR